MHGAAVKHESASVAARILRDSAFAVTETHYTDCKFIGRLYGCELRQFHKPTQHLNKIWILRRAHSCIKQILEITDGSGYALYKMLLALKIAAESVCAQHLQGAEKHKMHKSLTERCGVNLTVSVKRLHIYIYKVITQSGRISRTGLPKERSHIILHRSAASALKIYEPGLTLLDHYVTGLKVAVHERVVRGIGQQDRG